MSTHAARTEAPAARDAVSPRVAKLQGTIARVTKLVDAARLEADRIERHDWDMRRMNQRLAPGETPTGPMMPEFAERMQDQQDIAIALEAYRNELQRKLGETLAKERNRR
ncbi:hypothetical protein ACTZWW_04290 [Salinarimonas sp. NSM]|uniref:hypothetical protein n=1 Tax=Salinarimonas sp. NSM TaxID=3458003 RepID=UPI004036B096